MAQIETWYNQDLKHPVSVHYLHGVVFSQDNMGNVVGVNVFDNGVPATLSGTVSGSVIRSDGATVAITGTLSGNRASVAIPQSGYAVPGVISIIIKLTTGSVVTTLCAVVANVYLTQTGTVIDPGTIIPDISELIAEIETAIASIPADYSDLWESVAPNFNPNKSGGYKKGEYVTYDGGLYRFINAHSGTWNSADVVSTNIGNDISALATDIGNDISALATDIGNDISDLKSALEVIGEKVENLYDVNNVVIGKNWAGGDAGNRAYIQIPVTEGKTYTIIIPTNAVIPQVAVVQLSSNPSPLNSFYISGGDSVSFTAVTNCVNIRIQFEGNTTLSASDFNSYNVYVFEGTNEYFSAVDKIARRKLLNEYKKYIIIGDSYCEGYNPDGNVTGWGERLKSAMGLSNDNCIVKYKGGTGFYHASDGKTFSTLLDEAGANVDKKTITDIVVCGGWNDNSETLNHVYFDGVLAFATKVANEYPNAVLHVGMIGASNDSTVKQRLQNIVLFSYQYGALRKDYRYLNMVEYALSESNLATDGIHPNADGQVEITIAIKQALETGCAGLLYRFYNTIKTS